MAVIVVALKDSPATAMHYVNRVNFNSNSNEILNGLVNIMNVIYHFAFHFELVIAQPICQYNEDCPPTKLCDRLNRRCINPCSVDACGENAECSPVNHGVECRCLNGFVGNPYIECSKIQGCRRDSECSSSEACINGQCDSPCRCGVSALCEVINHRPVCRCPNGYSGDPNIGCNPPTNACDPNPCGTNAMCELDRGNPICFCPKGLTGNPFKNCSK